MRPALLLGLLLYGLVLAGLATLSGALLALGLPLLAYLAAGLLARPPAPSLSVTRTLSADRADAGAAVEVRVVATNTGAGVEELLLEDRVPAPLTVLAGTTRTLAALAPGASLELAYTVGGPRGVYRFDGIDARARDQLGLLTRGEFVAAPGQLFVVPEVLGLRSLAIRPRQTQIYAGTIPARQGGPGVEFFGVRAYQPGDPTRWISARVSARHAESLFVNEFEQERAAEVGLILDVRQASDIRTARGSLLEHGVQAAAALAAGLLDRGNRVGLLVYGNTLSWTYPGYGKVQRERILRALARAELGDAPVFEDFDRIPTRLFPARAQLILVSPLLPRDRDVLLRLRARGYQILVVSPNPIAHERQALGAGRAADLGARVAQLARVSLLHDIRRAGVAVLDWDVARPFQQVAAAALSRPVPLSDSLTGSGQGAKPPGRDAVAGPPERRSFWWRLRPRAAQTAPGKRAAFRAGSQALVRATVGAIGLAGLALALGYALAGIWLGALACLALAGLWLAAERRGWPAAALGLAGVAGAAAAGVLLGVAGALALAGVVAGLAGWDLGRFARRAHGAGLAAGEALERAHLRRLLLVLGAGLALGGLALSLRVSLSFGWALLLAGLAIGALARAIRLLGREQ